MERRLAVAQVLAVAVLVILLLAGCSASEQIAKKTNAIAETAASSKDRFAVIESEATAPAPDLPLIASEAVGGQEEQQTILEYTQGIYTALTKVEDEVPPWMSLLQYGAIALIVLGVGWILWYTGIGSLIKGILGFIPKAKRREADLAAAVMNDQSPATMREFVAARRAADPEFDKAYERATIERNRTLR